MEEHDGIYNDLRERHLQNCPKNFDGSPNAMEAECAVRVWSRSVEKFKLQYITMLCGGDSKSFDAIKETKMHGKDVPIQKRVLYYSCIKANGNCLKKVVDT